MIVEFKEIILGVLGTLAAGLATWLTTVIVTWLNKKIKDKQLATWATAVTTIVLNAVQAVFQSFVDALKKDGKFDKAKQEEAKERALEIIKAQLTDELKKYIMDNFGDLDVFLNEKVEAIIYQLKNK